MLTRKALADYLAVSVKSANRILPPTSSGSKKITNTRVIDLLNARAVGIQQSDGPLPTILTPEQLAAGITVNGRAVTPAKVLRWARRSVNPLPHYRLTRNCLRFTLAATTAWVDGRG